jgi:chitodextrinase
VLFAPSSASDRVTAVSADRGVMTVTGLTKGSCGAPPVRLGAPGHELGVPQELLGRLFVPDYTDHAVYIVDLGTNRLVAKSDVITKGGRFDLEPRGEFVFYNDATSEDAGVIRLDGRVTRVKKYNPDAPGAGLPSPRPESPSPPSSTPPPRPKPHVPQVAIALSAASVAVDHPVTLRVVATRGQVRAVRWDFGDGTSAAGIQVEHSWRAAGAYPVYATTTLEWDAVVVPEAMVQVTATPTASPSGSSTPTPTGTATSTPPPAGPTVSITASDTTPTAGDAVAFQLTVSGGTARDAYWDFGDTTTTHGLTSSHAWAHEGRYQVFAEVTFADGSKVAAKPIDLIVVAAPTASIEASTTTPLSGQTVDFHLVTSGGTPQTADWTFGTVSRRGLAPSYSWSDPGTYRVTAEVIFANGRHAVAPALTIKVTPACTSELAGHWTNVTTTGGVTKTDIFSSCSGYTQNFSVHVWGACHPSDCDWGTVGATKQSDSQLTAFYDPGFAEENVTLTYDRSSGLLTVTVFTHFTDDSGRADYTSTDTLSRTS